MKFDEHKKKYLDALYKPDRSKKGNVDQKIIFLIDDINNKEDYVTTSSCSGRIDLLKKNENSKKYEAEWPYVTHDFAKSKDVWKVMNTIEEGDVWFKMESPILHIMCRSVESAEKLIKMSVSCGFKYSGIFVNKPDRVMVQIMGCDKMEALIMKDGIILVDEEYIKISVEEANKKLKLSHKRLDDLHQKIKNQSVD